MGRLEGHHAVVTGGGSGIGLACAKAFVADGAMVTIMGRDEARLATALETLEPLGPARAFPGDAGREEDVAALVADANAAAPVTIAVANAGTGGLSPVIATEVDEWEGILRTNLTGTMLLFKHAGAAMAKGDGGALCAISSIAGVRTHRFMGSYCVSKAGIDMLVRNTADELGIANIRVNSVCPGLVSTELASGLFATEAVHADYLDCMPIRRTGEVADIANAVRFLCGPEASWITGVNLSVDGGHHLRRGPNVEPFARAMFGDDLTEGRP